MIKKILALILAATLLVFIVACDDENHSSGDNEIDVSTGGFFDDLEDTKDSADTAESVADTAEGTADETEELDTDTAEAAE